MIAAKDLSQEAPSSPRQRVGGYVLLARIADKGRADIACTIGDFVFNCPLDKRFFEFKGVDAGDVRSVLENGASNEALAVWLDANGTPRTEEEKKIWSDKVEAYRPFDDPEKREWFADLCAPLGLDPETSTLFDMLEADDKASYAAA